MIDWDDAFQNGSYIPGAADMPARWSERSVTMRDTLLREGRAMLDVSYGSHERACYDLFLPQDSPKGTVVFIHGGYWHLFDKSNWSHLAQGCLAHGWSVAMPSYPWPQK